MNYTGCCGLMVHHQPGFQAVKQVVILALIILWNLLSLALTTGDQNDTRFGSLVALYQEIQIVHILRQRWSMSKVNPIIDPNLLDEALVALFGDTDSNIFHQLLNSPAKTPTSMTVPERKNIAYRLFRTDNTAWFGRYSSVGGWLGFYDSVEAVKRSASQYGIKRYQVWKFHCGIPGCSTPFFTPEMVYEK